jgi:endoglucanase
LWMTAVGSNGGGYSNPHPGTYNPGSGAWTWIKFEFDKTYTLSELWVWNYNEWTLRGLKNVVIEYTQNGTTWNQLGEYQIARAPTDATGHGYDNYAHNTTIDFNGVEASSVIITTKEGVNNGNWGDSTPLYGLSEVRFYCFGPLPATAPSPPSGDKGVMVETILSWRPGTYAADVNGHDVYIGMDYNLVANANHLSGEFMGRQTDASYDHPSAFEFEQTYYWRIDEVNGTSLWPGDVWTFETAPAAASDPIPADGTTNVYTGSKLRWSVGGASISHDVYFGTNFDEVNTATPSSGVFKTNQPDSTYDPSPMDMNTTYYWRIDERDDSNTWPSRVWSFTTVDVELPLKLKRGISMGRGFPVSPSQTHLPEDIRFIKSMGFDHIKLLIDPIPLKNGSGLYDANMWYLDENVNLVVNEGLLAVVCLHIPESLRIKVMTNWQEFEDMLGFYEAIGNYMAARWSPRQVVFQFMTEPHSNAWDWNMMLSMIWQSIRHGMPNHTLIMCPTVSSLIEGLVNVVPVDDRNVIYCFGFYEPYFFSLQGWPFDSVYQLAGVPYPSSPEIIAAVLDDILADVPSQWQAQARADLIAYGEQRWNRDKLASRLKMATDWAKNNGGQKLWVHEWALYRISVNPEDGYRFVRDARELLEANDVGWAWFGYNDEISLTVLNDSRIPGGGHGPPDPGWIDKQMMNALGMFAGEGDVNHDGIINFHDFAEIADDWLDNRLWP